MPEKKIFVNVEMDAELVAELDQMVKVDESDRSKTIRRLIRQEIARRQQPVAIAAQAEAVQS